MLREHEKAVLTVDLADYAFQAGDVGTVVHVYPKGQAYELEVFALDGRTLDVVTVTSSQVRAVNQQDVMHVREMPCQLTTA